MGTTFPTRWPENLETEELPFIASAANVVNCDERELVLHKHRTGQITLAVQGQVNIQRFGSSCALSRVGACWRAP